MPPDINVTPLDGFDNGSHTEFPPLPWKNVGGTSSSATGEDILKKILEVNGDAIIPNNDTGNQHIPTAPMKGDRVPYASLFKSNRRAKSDYKLDKVEVSVSIPEFGIENIDFVEQTMSFVYWDMLLVENHRRLLYLTWLRDRGLTLNSKLMKVVGLYSSFLVLKLDLVFWMEDHIWFMGITFS